MKLTQENVKELNRLGFKRDTDSILEEDNWILSDGWGFDVTQIRNFYHLKNKIKKVFTEDNGKWPTDQLRSVYLKLTRKYPNQLKGSPQTKKQKLARTLTQARKLQNRGYPSTIYIKDLHKNQIAIMEFLLDS